MRSDMAVQRRRKESFASSSSVQEASIPSTSPSISPESTTRKRPYRPNVMNPNTTTALQDRVMWILAAGVIVTLCNSFGSQLPEPSPLINPTWSPMVLSGTSPKTWLSTHVAMVDTTLLVELGGARQVAIPITTWKGEEDTMNHTFVFSKDQPDYNGLNFSLFTNNNHALRTIWDHSIGPGPHYRDQKHESHYSYYYARDDDFQRTPYRDYDNWQDYEQDSCTSSVLEREMNHPACNPFHELDFDLLVRRGRAKLLGYGDFREAFSLKRLEIPERFVFKEASLLKNEDFSYKELDAYGRDGLVSAAVTPHPLFVDVYGYCSLSILSEFLNHGDMDAIAIGADRCPGKEPLVLEPPDRPLHFNNLTVHQKLQYALEMAEAVAMLHNHPMGVMVHDDIQLAQWFMGSDGIVKFNDFNRVEFMMYDQKRQAYCKYRNGVGIADWRSPEEYQDFPLDEKIDIYSLGNNFYALLTGMYPFPNTCDFKAVGKIVISGERSVLDPRWNNVSMAEGKLAELIDHCWKEDPNDRPSIGEIIRVLRTIQRQVAEKLPST